MLNTFTVVHITVLINNIPYSYQENKLTRNFYINHCIISCAQLQTVLNNKHSRKILPWHCQKVCNSKSV